MFNEARELKIWIVGGSLQELHVARLQFALRRDVQFDAWEMSIRRVRSATLAWC